MPAQEPTTVVPFALTVSCLVLQFCCGIDERRDLALGELVDPPVVDLPNGNRIEEVEFLPARFAGDDQACVFEQAQGLHDAEPGHLHLGPELGERAAVALEESIEVK